MVFTEAELQNKLNDLIKSEALLESIDGIDELDNRISSEQNVYIPTFLIDFKLNHRYVKSAKSIINAFGLYDRISGDSIKNISLDKSERLYPDYLLNNPETGQLILWELKKEKQTEREAITELLAYSLEIKNHLPLIPNSDIKLVIVSTEFNTLLEHAISMVLLGTNFDILCLKADIINDELKLAIYYPTAWSAIWQNDIPERAISSISLMLEKKSETQINLNWLKQVSSISTDLIEFEGNKIGSSGFCIFWLNCFDADLSVPFGLTICQINPYFFLEQSIKNGFKHNINGPLAKYILKNIDQFGTYYHPDSIENVANSAIIYLKQYFEITFEGYNNWEDQMFMHNNFRGQALPTIAGSWGDIGDFFRYFYLKSCTDEVKYFVDKELTLEKAYKDPVVAFQIINLITDRQHFKNGVYNTSSIFNFLKLITAYKHFCKIAFDTDNKNEVIKSKLFFLSTELSGAIKEIEYRLNSLKGKIEQAPPISIFFEDVTSDNGEEINDFLQWFKNHFIGLENGLHFLFFPKFYHWAQLIDPDTILKKVLVSDCVLEVEIGSFMKDYCKLIIKEVYYNKSIQYPFDLKSYLKELLNIELETDKKDITEIFNEIDQLKDVHLKELFDPIFLNLLDKTTDEVFHELTDNIDTKSINWLQMKDELTKRYSEGNKHTMIQLSNNGEIVIGQLPIEKRILGEIQDPDKEVFLEINYSGISHIQICNWQDIISGKAFKKNN